LERGGCEGACVSLACPECGYDRSGDAAARCPECGSGRNGEESVSLRGAWIFLAVSVGVLDLVVMVWVLLSWLTSVRIRA
jgi:hypothetical protein